MSCFQDVANFSLPEGLGVGGRLGLDLGPPGETSVELVFGMWL